MPRARVRSRNVEIEENNDEEEVATAYPRDIEETDEQLEEAEVKPFEFWVGKQRELIPNVVDYSLQSLADLVFHKTIDLKPQYQRRHRWNEARQSKLIESFLMNVPVPPVFLNEDEFGTFSVIDGKQRLTAISSFMRGNLRLTGLKVFTEINDKRFDDLHPKFQNVIRTRPTLRAVIILKQSDPDIKTEVFERLNTGGVRLNAQEIRNAAYTGPLNDLILEVSELPEFHSLLRIKDKEKSVIYQEMRDAELVLRFLTLRNRWKNFTNGPKKAMDDYASNNRSMSSDAVKMERNDFIKTLRVVKAALGEHAFRRWMPESGAWRRSILVALYDAEMIGFYNVPISAVVGKELMFQEGVKQLFTNDSFNRSINAATNNTSNLRDRVNLMKAMIDGIVKA